MPSIRDLYPFYLTADHLQGRTVVVHISSVAVEELWNGKSKRKEQKLVVRFHNKKLALACNKTQATQLERITGSDDYIQWVGHTVTLSPTQAPSGTHTIAIVAAPTQPSAAAANRDHGHDSSNNNEDNPDDGHTTADPAQPVDTPTAA